MSRPKLMLQLVYVYPEPWVDGDVPPPASRMSSPVTIPWDMQYDSEESSFEDFVSRSVLKAIARNPKIVDVAAKLLAEKVKKKFNAKG